MRAWARRSHLVLHGLIVAGVATLLVVLATPPAPAGRRVVSAPALGLHLGQLAPPVRLPALTGASAPSPFGRLTSARWAYGARYRRRTLAPVKNPNPSPEPQPRREHPFDVVVSKDGRKVYVGLIGSEIRPGSQVAVFDVASERVVKRIELAPGGRRPSGSSPYRLTLHPSGRYVVVTNRFSNFASVIDTNSDRVVSEIPLDFYCQQLLFDASGSTAYVANRYLDQVLVVDAELDKRRLAAKMHVLGGIDAKRYAAKIKPLLARRCASARCHDRRRGGLLAKGSTRATLLSVLELIKPGRPDESLLLRAPTAVRHGGYADRRPRYRSHAGGTVVFADPKKDADYRALRAWIAAGGDGPGIPIGNPRSKPKVLALSSDGRWLFVGNTGTQDISIVNTKTRREVGAIYIQNIVNDLKIHRSPGSGRDVLLVTTEGVGFGVGRERDPYGGESWRRDNPAAQFSVWRDLRSGRVLPKAKQVVLGPMDATDGTAAIKFRDIQNDVVLIDVAALKIPDAPPAGGPEVLLTANRYEAHRGWVRYTSDTAESTRGDIKGDIPPDLMRVKGAIPEKMAIVGDRLWVTMQASHQVQRWRINLGAADPSDKLVPEAVYDTGLQPIGVAAGRPGTPSAGKVFVANFLGGSLSIIDSAKGSSREVVIDPSVKRLPFPATNAERGELFVHSARFSSDGDTSCFHCHYLDTSDGRPWGVSQVVGQEYVPREHAGQLVIGGTMGVPQMRALFKIQPFFFEGTLSAFEPRSMIMEHAPADDFAGPIPAGDFSHVRAHLRLRGVDDVQSSMSASSAFAPDLERARDAFFAQQSLRYMGKAFTMRDFVRFVGEWQVAESRLLPNPFDQRNPAVLRGRALFSHEQVGCRSCHPPPDFTRKDFPHNPEQAFPPMVTFTARDGAFTLIGLNRLDAINGLRRDLEPNDRGRAERTQGHITVMQLRGIWDRPPLFLHNGMARTLREVIATPGHPALGRFKYEPRIGGVPERPGRREVGFNMTWLFTKRSPKVRMHLRSGARLGFDTHGGTSQLTARQIDDLVSYLQSIE